MLGTIDKIVEPKGFGFIRRANEHDIFFHCSELAKDLEWNEALIERRVSFDILDTKKGPRAIHIRPTI